MKPDIEHICIRLRGALAPWNKDISEKAMFGGHSFLYKGKMCVGALKGMLVVRIPSIFMDSSLAQEDVEPMTFTGKPMKEFVYVHDKGFDTEEKLQHWVEMGIAHAKSKVGE